MPSLTFYGAAQEVTGSCHLLSVADSRILLDCGMHQGSRQSEKRNAAPFAFDPKTIDAVILSHGHLDHSGLLPRLFKEGYQGPVYCTQATCNLLAIMLEDAANLQMRDVEWENKRLQRAGRPLQSPIYDLEDVLQVLQHCVGLPYHQTRQIQPGVELCFYDAGHILGSAIVSLALTESGQTRKLVFSGDLGNADSVLMRSPENQPEIADVVLMEGTYGDRDHRTLDYTLEELESILKAAHADGGNVLIPSFAVGRTQEMLFHLSVLHRQGRLPQQQIFLDSPMGIEVTRLYADYMELLDPKDLARIAAHKGDGIEKLLPNLTLTPTTDESMNINRIKNGAVIIAGSGMCNGGRIRHHLKYNIWRPECHLVFPGFQAQGTLGRRIVDGASHVKMFGSVFAVKAQVHTLGGFSAHAGQSQLIGWAGHFERNPRFYLVHGEEKALQELQRVLKERQGIEASVPELGEAISF
jgi:metallo-beta-lactamase family protein